MKTQEKGRQAEERAAAYLAKQGLKLVLKNYRCRFGEIDLIMLDKQHLVFIEVRSRVSTRFGGGVASVTYTKRQKILKTASCFILEQQQYQHFALRFDVVGLDGNTAALSWVKDAFGADY